jgi:glycine/D-amino acid oxidase-like deaminating enzyme
MSPQAPADQIVIVGGGIIGLCSAYYILTSPLLPRNSTVVIIEASKHGVAQAASSSAGGFISRDWHTNPVLSLAKLSWECHNELANKLKGEQNYGWRMCGAVGLTVGDELVERSAYRILPEGKAQTRKGDWLNGAREDMVRCTIDHSSQSFADDRKINI